MRGNVFPVFSFCIFHYNSKIKPPTVGLLLNIFGFVNGSDASEFTPGFGASLTEN
jgi:hypothetical protein